MEESASPMLSGFLRNEQRFIDPSQSLGCFLARRFRVRLAAQRRVAPTASFLARRMRRVLVEVRLGQSRHRRVGRVPGLTRRRSGTHAEEHRRYRGLFPERKCKVNVYQVAPWIGQA